MKACGDVMSEQDYSKYHFWDIKEERGLLMFVDPDKHLSIYVKWDGEVHVWYYDRNEMGYDHDTGLADYTAYGFSPVEGHHDFYRIIDIDEEITRLQSLKSLAAQWFAEHKNQRWPPDLLNLDSNTVRLDELAWNDPRRKRGDNDD